MSGITGGVFYSADWILLDWLIPSRRFVVDVRAVYGSVRQSVSNSYGEQNANHGRDLHYDHSVGLVFSCDAPDCILRACRPEAKHAESAGPM